MMPIWSYNDTLPESQTVWSTRSCPFCTEQLYRLLSEHDDKVIPASLPSPLWTGRRRHGPQHISISRNVSVCRVCGWWTAVEEKTDIDKDFIHGSSVRSVRAAVASLMELDLTDTSVALEDVRSFLAARYEARFDVDPIVMEQTVASVYRDHGYQAHVTARSGDDGIDVILRKGNETIGVQVKRHRDSSGVDQIRALAGALVLGNLTKGIFVTTSSFQRGAAGTAERLGALGYPIELVDAPRFYAALRLAQRGMYASLEQFDAAHALGQMQVVKQDTNSHYGRGY